MLHMFFKTFDVGFTALFLQDFLSQLQREAISIMEFEYLFPFKQRLMLRFHLGYIVLNNTHALINCTAEFGFFNSNDLLDIILFFF